MNKKIVKEVFIMILLILVILFVIGLLFYDLIPFKEDITSVEYKPDEEVLKAVEEIQGNTNQVTSNEDALLKSYSIDKEDLNIYANQKSYESGKQDPFAEYSEPIEETTRTETASGIPNNANNNSQIVFENSEETQSDIKQSSNSQNVVKNEENKNEVENTQNEENSTTGTFFENKNSK